MTVAIDPERAFYRERLADPSLLDGALEFKDGEHITLCVPVGGTRRGGYIPLSTLNACRRAARLLTDREGFPNLRIVKSTDREVCHNVAWGDPAPGVKASDLDRGRFYGYSEQAIAKNGTE